MSLADSAAAKPLAAADVDAALDDVTDESKMSEGLVKPKSTMVSSFEEYLQNRGYEPWRSTFVYSWSPTTNNNHYSSCLPAFCYKGSTKPNSAKVAKAPRGTIQEKIVQVKVVENGEEISKDLKVKSIVDEAGKTIENGGYCWANPNREVDATSGKAGDYFKPPQRGLAKLEYDTLHLQMELFEVVADETADAFTQIKNVDFCIRGGLFSLFKWEFRTQKHTYNWGLGSTREDFFKIITCLLTLWGLVGLVYYLLLIAALETADTMTTLWLFFGMMFTGWFFIGISLSAQKITDARAKRKEQEAKDLEGTA
jgi:hypothetical protein